MATVKSPTLFEIYTKPGSDDEADSSDGEGGARKITVSQLPKGWRKKGSKKKNGGPVGFQPATTVTGEGTRKLTKALGDLCAKKNSSYEVNLVEGFCLEKCPKYRQFIAEEKTARTEAFEECMKTNKGRKGFGNTMLIVEDLNQKENNLNIAKCIVDSDRVEQVQSPGDGYDHYYHLFQGNSRE
eukprot:gene17403-20713_t